jgi:hypothetical protein
MARHKKKVEAESGEEYMVNMQIEPDQKGFSLDVTSETPMEADEIVMVIEVWLQENIMMGFAPASETRH